MNTIFSQSLDKVSGVVLIPLFETESSVVFKEISVSNKIFSGKKDSQYWVKENENFYLFIGLGKEINYKDLKTIFRRIAAKQKDYFDQTATLVFPDAFTESQIEAAVSGLYLGTYDLGHFKKIQKHSFLNDNFELSIVSKVDCENTVSRALKIAKSQFEIMTLVDLPPNVVNPKYLANWATETGKNYGFEVEVLGFEAAKKLGLEAFLSVGKGSEQEPQFVIMNYIPENQTENTKHFGLVGKGVTFDTGGLNIKTTGMLHMKCDMAGAAAVLGSMQLIADLKLPVKVTAIVPCVENAIDSKSFYPSDVIQSYSGHSIEIIDTDAEGRLILADALSYLIKNFNPEFVVDIATLTGSCVGTFGYDCAALFTNNDLISKKIQQSGDAIGERLWQLPLWDSYKPDIESEIADVKNYSGKPVAGAISAAKFLEFFTDNHQAWAHLDIAGVAFGDDEFAKTKHATAYGVHLLTTFIEKISPLTPKGGILIN